MFAEVEVGSSAEEADRIVEGVGNSVEGVDNFVVVSTKTYQISLLQISSPERENRGL